MANHGGLLAARGQRSHNIWPCPLSQAVNYVCVCEPGVFFVFSIVTALHIRLADGFSYLSTPVIRVSSDYIEDL